MESPEQQSGASDGTAPATCALDGASALPVDAETRDSRIQWMAVWAAKNGAALELEGECGFGRECVGVSVGGSYPDYHWHNDRTGDQEDANGSVWCPVDAYHKHDCVAVLGRGEEAERQLYDWLRWFDANGFKLESGQVKNPPMDAISILMGKHRYVRMVKKAAA
jgi:hypothetical protein